MIPIFTLRRTRQAQVSGMPCAQQAASGRAFLLAVKAMLVLALFILGAVPAAWLSAPIASAHALDDSGASQAVTLDSPAVVRIISTIEGVLVCQGCDSSGADIVSPQNPNQPFVWYTAGSGAFVSPDGYILTADHVVDHNANNPGDADFLLQLASQDIGQRYGIDPNTALNFLENNLNRVQFAIQAVTQMVFLSTAYTGQLQTTGAVVSYPVTRIVVNSPVNQQDTAIIQVGAQDMPNLTLAQASDVTTSESITAIAFPADADQVTQNGGSGTGDFTPLVNPSQSDAGTISSLLTPTIETGQITAQKTATGTLYYESSAIGNHGSSGGSVVDDQGRIIGFVDQGTDSGRVTVLVSSSVAASYVRQAGVNNSGQGTFETTWTKAVNEYYATSTCHFTNASSDLSKLHTNYPQFGGIEPLLKNAQDKATPSDCPAPGNSLLIFGAVGGGLVLLVLVVLVIFLLLRRRRQPQPVPVAAGVGYPAAAGALPSMLPQTVFPQSGIGLPVAPPFSPQGSAPVSAGSGYAYGAGAAGLPSQPILPQSGQAYPSGPQQYAAGLPAQPGMPQAGQAYPSGPQQYQTAQAPGAASNGYGYPQVPGSMPMMPQGGVQQPGAGQFSAPPAYPAAPVPPAFQQAQAPAARVCIRGHRVTEPTAQFCPDCGAPIQQGAYR